MAWDSDYRYEPSPLFEQSFCCRPFSKYKNPQLETGEKIVMPPSSLNRMLDLRIGYPLLFKIESYNSDKTSHCGVLEFEAEEGVVYVPDWMMRNLQLEEGDAVILRNAALSRGVYMKLQPHSTSFIELTNVRAVLEKTLRGFSCVSRGDTIMVRYGEREFYLDVLEVAPGAAITLIETDCRVDFAPPLDYEEPERDVDRDQQEGVVEKVGGRGEEEEEGKVFRPFAGAARRLDGEAIRGSGGGGEAPEGRPSRPVGEEGKKSEKDGGKEAVQEKFKPFTGRSRVLGGL